LPFAAAIPEGVKAYTLAYTGGNEVNATEVEETIPANTPVLLNGTGDATFTGSSAAIAADADNVDGALTGVFATTFVPENSYVLQKQEEKIGFFKVEEANSIEAAPFRAYLTATSEARRLSIKFDEGGTTGISLVNNEVKANNRYFNLNGQRVMKPAKGLYIVNNKKVILK
jgi:glucuronoarabinoxylan endo-1,4-beta-xylanase